ncbi:M1 family metallopeptidase [Sphingomonas sp.]|uniref:M1 family metallopeptidase n=1 Tax=Sphingomonas sp. TaxID=28214 RepID=UPI0025D048EE|nr:M1 family metallopeptidase [Sphingomonas sp.]
MSRPVFATLSVAVSLLASTALAAPGRLPGGVTPLAYDIIVEPDAAKLTFTGSETITILVDKPTRSITLNSADIVIASVKLDGSIPATIAMDEAGQRATFTFPAALKAGQHRLAITYSGIIHTSATGLFAIDYDGERGAKERLLVTQFEAPDARRFAPMWDEPGFKTPFTLSAVAPTGQTAFSNMPVTGKSVQAQGKTLWRFAPTPKMSSYLLFLGIGNVDRKTVMEGNVEIGVITRKGVVDQGDYALASARKVLAAYNDYFGTPYPLPKMDMIAGPGSSQFFGAMENWGAIFYFERILLIDPKLQTENQKQDIFNVVAHEMAHQWFGDLVTMNWWDDLWLNEGFASWMASKVSGDLNPSWGATTQTLAFDRQSAITRDARLTTHPIIQHVETVDEISTAFDDITYRKGEAVIRMLEGAVGPDVFRQGVRSYMAKYKYGNTVTDQLWTEIAAASGKPVAAMMHSYTLQGGVPLIRVGTPVCKDGMTTLPLSQDRFGLDAASRVKSKWIVPVRVGSATGAASALVSVSGSVPVPVSVPTCGLTIANKGQSAYFRTLYTPAHQEALRAGFSTLSVDDQIGFAADTLALANGSYQPIDRYLALVDGISPDASPILWSMIAGQLGSIDRVLTDAPEQSAFRSRATTLLRPVFARLGWVAKANEAPADAQLREHLIPLLGSFGDRAVVAEAVRYAAMSFSNPAAVSGAIRQPAQRVYADTADAARWDDLHAKAKAESSPVAKLMQYSNLGTAQDIALAQKALDLVLTDEVPVPMRGNIVQAVAGEHPALAFDWAVAHAAQVNAFLETSTRSAFIVGLAAGSGDPAVGKRVASYAATLPAASRKPAEQTISAISYRAGLRSSQAAALGKWAMRK